MSEDRFRFCDLEDEPRRMLPAIQGYEKEPLVSLEESVEKLVEYIDDIRQQVSDAKKRCKTPPANGLSIDESAAILLYTMEWKPKEKCVYVVLNKHLRAEERNLLKLWFRYLKLLITSLGKIPSTSCRLYRGVKLNLSDKHPVGQTTIWWGFSSCTTSMKVLEKNEQFFGKTGVRTLFQIDCYSGKDIRQHSRYSTEDEVLLLAATQFKIDSCFNAGDGLHIIQLKEIEPKFPLIEKGQFHNGSSPTDQVESSSSGISKSPTNGSNNQVSDLRNRITRASFHSTVDLSKRRLINGDMNIICEDAIKGKSCERLVLSDTQPTSQNILTLVENLRENNTLKKLDLSNNQLSDNDLMPLIRQLSTHKPDEIKRFCFCIKISQELDKPLINTLNIGYNNISDEGAENLVEVLKVNQSLTILYLNNNRIADRSVRWLADVLSRPESKLVKLYLQNNKLISDNSVNCLVNMLRQNRSLNTLWLGDCGFTYQGRDKLREAIVKKKDFFLNVDIFDSLTG